MSSPTDHWNKCYHSGKDFRLISGEAIDKILGYLKTDNLKTCLDIGCGTGQLSRELFHRGFNVVGVDVSDAAIARASSRTAFNEKGLVYKQNNIEDATDDSIFKETYGLITCKLVIAFIKDKINFLKTVYSLMKDDSIFVIITPALEDVLPEKKNIAVDIVNLVTIIESANFSIADKYKSDGLTYIICKKAIRKK